MSRINQGTIWVFIEQRGGRLAEVAFQVLGKALELADPMAWKVATVLVGHKLTSLHDEILAYGAHELLVADDPLLMSYCGPSYAKLLADAVRKYRPDIFLLGSTAMGTDLGARLAARLRTGLSAHCIDFELSSAGELLAVVPGWGGNVLARVRCPHARPQMASVMPGVFETPPKRISHGQIIPLEVDLKPEDVTYQILETRREEIQENALENAEVIVAGGWGVGSKSDWLWMEKLASALNGVVGATRPPVDEGWAREDQMIGQSSHTVHPRLYIGVAVSGHMHHVVGIKDAKQIVAINQDPKAPFFELCDLGLVGDFREILPPLIKGIRLLKGE